MPESGFGDGKAEPGHSQQPGRSTPLVTPANEPGSSLSRLLRAAPAVLGPGPKPVYFTFESHNTPQSLKNEPFGRWYGGHSPRSVIKSNAEFFNSGTCGGCGWQPMANVESTPWARVRVSHDVGGERNWPAEAVRRAARSSLPPHVAFHDTAGRRSNVGEEMAASEVHQARQAHRKRIEEVFGWVKTVARLSKTPLAHVHWQFPWRLRPTT